MLLEESLMQHHFYVFASSVASGPKSTVVMAVTAVRDFMRKVFKGTFTVAKSKSPHGVSTKIADIAANTAATANESFKVVDGDTALHFNHKPVVRLLNLDLDTAFTRGGIIASTKGSIVVIQNSVRPKVVANCTSKGQKAPRKVDM